MNIKIIGNNYISNHLYHLYDFGASVDILYFAEINSLMRYKDFNEHNTHFVFYCHEYKGDDKQKSYRENVELPTRIALYCKRHSVPFFYLSTAHFYNFRNKYEENTETLEDLYIGNLYLRNKLFGEQRILQKNPKSVILRGKNYFDNNYHEDNFIVKTSKKDKLYNSADTHTYLPDLCKVIEKLFEIDECGIFNVVCPDFGSEVYIMSDVLQIPKFTHLNAHMKEHNDIIPGAKLDQGDVNSEKIQKLVKLTPPKAAFLLAYQNIKNDLQTNQPVV